MRTASRIFIVLVLLCIEVYAVYAVLHPRVSPEYRAYYIDRTSTDWHVPHYPATPQEGIIFSRKGWPDFVNSAYGFSFREDWGRWTDAGLPTNPKIIMNRKFSGTVCLEFVARPSVPEQGKTVGVSLGQNRGMIMLTNPDYTTYRVSFDNASPADTIEFHFDGKIPATEEVIPNSTDGRRLGIGLISLRILPFACP